MAAREPPKQVCAHRAMSSRDCGERLGGRSKCKLLHAAIICLWTSSERLQPLGLSRTTPGPERYGAGISMLRAF